MKELRGTVTHANLMTAFAGESQARNKYSFYAAAARRDGYEHMASVFEETAANEREHAKIWFKLLHDGLVPDTVSNLDDAADGERFEWSEMYVSFAADARGEGFEDIATLFELVGDIEKTHEQRFRALTKSLTAGVVFESPMQDEQWVCANCGHIHTGKSAPDICPVCKHPRAFFKRRDGGC